LNINTCPQTSEEKEKMAQVPYSNAVGSLMFAMTCTRPDICYAVDLVSRFQANPSFAHWKAVKRILYLKGIMDYMLCYQAPDLGLVSYNDADWGDDPNEHKSNSGYTFLLNGGAITWCSKKQTCVALSTMEAEYVAGSVAVQEGVWLRKFLQEFGIVPVTIYCGNSTAIAYSKHPMYHEKNQTHRHKIPFFRHMIVQKR